MSETPARIAVPRSAIRVSPTVTSPAAGRTAPAITHSSDDLPAPDGPVRASRVPGGTTRSTSSTATRLPYRTATPRTTTDPSTASGSGVTATGADMSGTGASAT